jgi:hypothetical protein
MPDGSAATAPGAACRGRGAAVLVTVDVFAIRAAGIRFRRPVRASGKPRQHPSRCRRRVFHPAPQARQRGAQPAPDRRTYTTPAPAARRWRAPDRSYQLHDASPDHAAAPLPSIKPRLCPTAPMNSTCRWPDRLVFRPHDLDRHAPFRKLFPLLIPNHQQYTPSSQDMKFFVDQVARARFLRSTL